MPLFSGSSSASAAVHPGYVTGRFYATALEASPQTIEAINIIFAYPFYLANAVTLASLAARVTTAGTTSAMKAAVYADHSTLHRPNGAAIYADDTGVATTASTTTLTWTTTASLAAGWYWFMSKHSGAATPIMVCIAAPFAPASLYGGTAGAIVQRSVISIAHAYATAWPTYNGADSWLDTTYTLAPMIWLGL